MPRLLSVLFVLAALARPAAAQMYFGAELSPGGLLRAEEAKLSRENDDAFARAFVLDNSTAALYSVFGSTAPEIAASAWLRQGIYRQELLVLFSMAASTGAQFGTLAKAREKGATLRELAGRYNADLLKLFKEAGAKQKALEGTAAREEELFNASLSAAAAAEAKLSTAPAPGAAPVPENDKK